MINIYFLCPICVVLVWLLFLQTRSYHIETVEGKKKYRWDWIAVVVLVLVLAWLCMSRPNNFGDTGTYIKTYNALPKSWNGITDYINDHPKDSGFTLLMWLSKMIGLSVQWFFYILAAIQLLLVFSVYRKYSSNLFFSAFLFVISTDFFSWNWNGIRQFMAAAICFAAAPAVFDKQFVKAILLFVVASSFHQSALFMIPIIFLAQGKVFSARTALVVCAGLLAIVFVGGFEELLDGMLQETQYANMVTDYKTGVIGVDNGTNPVRVLVYSVPAILALIGKKSIERTDSTSLVISANMSIISACIYLISMVTSGIFIGRMPIYCSLYNYILLPWELKNLFNKESSRLVFALCYISYFVFFTYQMKVWNILSGGFL